MSLDFHTIKLHEIPNNHYWRVDYLNRIIGNGAINEPTLEVHISRIKGYKPGVKSPFEYSSDIKTTIYIGIGHASILYKGAVFFNKLKVKEEKFAVKKFRVNTKQTLQITLDATNELGQRLIPTNTFSVQSNVFASVQKTPIVCIEQNNDPYAILIPLIEILRFYYLLSSQLSLALLQDHLPTIFEGRVKVDEINNVTIDMPDGWDVENAWFIARYWTSEDTKEVADSIRQWVSLIVINKKERLHKNNLFPFKGESLIKATGRYITGNDGIKRFFCTQLINCTGAFNCGVVSVIDKRYEKDENKKPEGDTEEIIVWPGPSASSGEFSNEEEPTKNYYTTKISQLEKRFKAINGRRIHRKIVIIENENKVKKKKVYKDAEDPKKLGTGTGHYGDSSTKKAEVLVSSLDEDVPIPLRLTEFLQTLAYLSKYMHVETLAIELPRDDNVSYNGIWEPAFKYGNIFFNGCIHFLKTKYSWARFEVNGAPKYRSIIIAECKIGDKYAYLSELERKPRTDDSFSIFILYDQNFNEIKKDKLFRFIKQISTTKNGWPNQDALKSVDEDWRRITQIHSGNFAQSIKIKLESAGFPKS